jgi:hypothetical protein
MPSIFLLQGQTGLVEMTQQPYESEGLLQQLLATHPSILAGDQFNGPEPKRWLLIDREAGVPEQADGADRWSLDHLFVDQHGIPTFVEVKRSSDTRIRREVIGQMFEYAANAVAYWGPGQVRSQFEKACEIDGISFSDRLAEFLRLQEDTAGANEDRFNLFWNDVDTNLRAGRIRMVFVSDTIPPELRRIVEFLNSQMNPAEVLAIEIKQFTGSGVTTLVPSVIGQTAQAAAQRNRAARQGTQWNMDSFLDALGSRKGQQVRRIAERLFQWCDNVLPVVWWGSGAQDGSCFRGVHNGGKNVYFFAVWTYGKIELQFQWLARFPPFNSEAIRAELLGRLNKVPGVNFGVDAVTRRPSFDLAVLDNPQAETAFREVMHWAVAQVRSSAVRESHS